MINELMLVSQAVERAGITVPDKNPAIRILQEKRCITCCLNPHGKIARVEPVKQQLVWTLYKSNHCMFPMLKIGPLFLLTSDANVDSGKDNSKEKLDLIFELKGTGTLQPNHDYLNNLFNTFTWFAGLRQYLRLPGNQRNACDAVLRTFAARVCKATREEKDKWLDTLVQALFQLWQDNLNENAICSLCREALVGKADKKTGKRTSSVKVFFDVSDISSIQYRLCSEEVAARAGMLFPDHFDEDEQIVGCCACTGQTNVPLIGNKSHNPPLPLLGQSYIFAMNKDDKCHQRYGWTSTSIFPISASHERRLANVISWITSPERENKTWAKVWNGKWRALSTGKVPDQDLLIVYCEEEPLEELSYAKLLVGDAADGTAVYEAICSQVCQAACARDVSAVNPSVRIVVLNKVDQGRRQIVLNQRVDKQHFLNAAQQWHCGAREFSFTIGDSSLVTCPFPAHVIPLLQKAWFLNGLDHATIPGPNVRDVLALFLTPAKNNHPAALMLLRLFMARCAPLLIAQAHAWHQSGRRMVNKSDQSKKRETDVPMALGLLSILLFKTAQHKEALMKDYHFLVGQLLGHADILHREYSILERGIDRTSGRLPPLLGNALIPTALNSPVTALARILERMRIYLDWANRHYGEQYACARASIKAMRTIAARLEPLAPPPHANDVAKAQLLLGYLSYNHDVTTPTMENQDDHTN